MPSGKEVAQAVIAGVVKWWGEIFGWAESTGAP